jgi:hypothetical protein
MALVGLLQELPLEAATVEVETSVSELTAKGYLFVIRLVAFITGLGGSNVDRDIRYSGSLRSLLLLKMGFIGCPKRQLYESMLCNIPGARRYQLQ